MRTIRQTVLAAVGDPGSKKGTSWCWVESNGYLHLLRGNQMHGEFALEFVSGPPEDQSADEDDLFEATIEAEQSLFEAGWLAANSIYSARFNSKQVKRPALQTLVNEIAKIARKKRLDPEELTLTVVDYYDDELTEYPLIEFIIKFLGKRAVDPFFALLLK